MFIIYNSQKIGMIFILGAVIFICLVAIVIILKTDPVATDIKPYENDKHDTAQISDLMNNQTDLHPSSTTTSKTNLTISTDDEFYSEEGAKVQIEMDVNSDGNPYVEISLDGRIRIVTSTDDLMGAMPFLKDTTKWIVLYARLINFLSEGYRFELITKPNEFEAKYRETYEAEDPNEEITPGTQRLHNYGIPDFSEIESPKKDGDTLIFFAVNTFTGFPYKAVYTEEGKAEYTPVTVAE